MSITGAIVYVLYQDRKLSLFTPLSTTPKTGNALDIPFLYAASEFRVLSVIANPYWPDASFVVATKRDRVGNDGFCGSIYAPDKCYFFEENAPTGTTTKGPHFIAAWRGHFDELMLPSVKFTDRRVVQFQSTGGDAGISEFGIWQVDLQTGSVTEISHVIDQ